MTKQAIIEQTIKIINQLPTSKAEEISRFAEFLIEKYEDQTLREGFKNIIMTNKTFEFLNDEPNLYSESDLKINFNDKR